MKKIEPVKPELTEKVQQGKVAWKGASDDIMPEMGGMPASGNFEKNAGEPSYSGGSFASGAMKGEGGTSKSSAHAKQGPGPSHEETKKSLKPGSHGGARTGSVDTLTKLIFHPKGGFDNKELDTRKSPRGSGGYKDSGPKTGRRVTGVNRTTPA
jgi:hypothetical protein